jgi:hypothetical protein
MAFMAADPALEVLGEDGDGARMKDRERICRDGDHAV